jgi:hypothetical protein
VTEEHSGQSAGPALRPTDPVVKKTALLQPMPTVPSYYLGRLRNV